MARDRFIQLPHREDDMALRDKPPFRADHVGSLLRPAALAETREKHRKGEVPDEELRRVEDAAVLDAIGLQERVGLKGITDGEMRRDYWHLDFMCGFDGVELSQETYGMKFNAGISVATTYVGGKVSYPEGGNMLDHFKYLNSEVHETAKFCFPTAGMYHFRPGRDGVSEEAYPDLEEFWEDIGRAYNDAVMDFIANGATYLQIDDVNFCYLCDQEQRERVTARGDDPDGLLDTYIRVNNASIAGRPDNVTVTTHMCRGNFQSSWMAQGGYEPVAEKMFNETDVDGFFMEFDSDRAGDFEPLRFVPKDKMVVLGLVTSKFPELEPKDELKARVEEASRYVDIDQLCISPQCGFASTHHGNKLSEAEQEAKLALCVEVANDIWGE